MAFLNDRWKLFLSQIKLFIDKWRCLIDKRATLAWHKGVVGYHLIKPQILRLISRSMPQGKGVRNTKTKMCPLYANGSLPTSYHREGGVNLCISVNWTLEMIWSHTNVFLEDSWKSKGTRAWLNKHTFGLSYDFAQNCGLIVESSQRSTFLRGV